MITDAKISHQSGSALLILPLVVMMVVVLESFSASTEGDDGFQDISGIHATGYKSTRDGQGGGTWGWGGGSGWMRIKAYLHLITLSSREGSHFKWKLVFWLLLYPLDQSHSLPRPLENLLARQLFLVVLIGSGALLPSSLYPLIPDCPHRKQHLSGTGRVFLPPGHRTRLGCPLLHVVTPSQDPSFCQLPEPPDLLLPSSSEGLGTERKAWLALLPIWL